MASYRVRKALKIAVRLLCIYVVYAVITFTYSNVIRTSATLDQRGLIQNLLHPKFAHLSTTSFPNWASDVMRKAYLEETLHFTTSPSSSCETPVTVAVLVSSKPENVDIRQAIRETWGNSSVSTSLGIRRVFVLGLPTGEKIGEKIAKEADIHGDVVVGNFTESGRIATLKLLLGFTWASQRCRVAKFVFYGHDHMFVYYDQLLHYLKSLRGEELTKSWHGRLSASSVPVRDPKSVYYVSKEDFPRNVFPEYCTSEAGFVLSIDAVGDIVSNSSYAPTVALDDIFLAIVAEKLFLKLFNSHAFSLNFAGVDGCPATNLITAITKAKTGNDLRKDFEHSLDEGTGQNCSDPKLEWVLPTNVSNANYFQKALNMLIQHDDVCYESTGDEKDIFLIALVSSLPSHFHKRQAIRETWGAQREIHAKKIALIFTLGVETSTTHQILSKIQDENRLHGDIIQGQFEESFHNLTLKVIMGLKWLTEHCPHAKYVYKGDDDMFVNLKNVVTFLEKYSRKENPKPLFMGNAMWSSVHIVNERSKYHVSNSQYKGKFYPPYCSGGGYVFTGSIVPSMYRASRNTALIPIDDAFHGILAKKIGVPITHHDGFKVFGSAEQKYNYDKCFLESIMVVHKYDTAVQLHDVWNKYTDTSVRCD